MARLKESFSRPLSLISAPAGFGKTTLLSEWNSHSAQPLAWLSLDREDNDPFRFWLYLITALRRLKPELGEDALSLLTSHRPQPAPDEFFLTILLNEVADLADHLTLVLDDYHLITAQSIHDGLVFLLDHIPPNLHLVLLTRADPPFPLGRLRARDQLSEIRAAELSFTVEEAALFFNQAMRLNLTSEEIFTLEARTEGWITGLQLAALSMQGRKDVGDFIAAFTGSHRYILDYLVEEVFQRQPEKIQGFLLKTSILERMAGPLCDAITEEKDSRLTLAQLEQANLFIIPLDDEREWYRFHHLFAEFLRQRLLHSEPDFVATLHLRASRWYASRGLVAEAIAHALAAEDYEQAAGLIEQNGQAFINYGEFTTLLGWIDRLPEEVVLSRPFLNILYVRALGFTGEYASIEPRLRQAEEAIRQKPSTLETNDLSGQILAIRAFRAVVSGEIPHAIELFKQALELLAEENRDLRALTAMMQGDALWTLGEGAAAITSLEKAIRISQAAGNIQVAITAMNVLARIYVANGYLNRAEDIIKQSLQLAVKQDGGHLPVASVAYAGMGLLLWERNEAQGAIRYLLEGIDLASRGGDVDGLLGGYFTLARIYQATGDRERAHEMIEKADQLIQSRGEMLRSKFQLAAHKVRLALAQEDFQTAVYWSEALKSRVEEYARHTPLPLTSPLRVSENITRARVLIAQNQPAEARRLLEQLLPALEAAGRNRSVIEVLALQAMAFWIQGERSKAADTLARALSLSEPVGFFRLFLDEGSKMELLLRKVCSQEAGSQYARRLLAALETERRERPGISEKKPIPSSSGFILVDPLSERELEVLRLVANGCSNQEIAQALFITLGTVKRHLNNIFVKLGVSSRTQAIAFGRELGLL